MNQKIFMGSILIGLFILGAIFVIGEVLEISATSAAVTLSSPATGVNLSNATLAYNKVNFTCSATRNASNESWYNTSLYIANLSVDAAWIQVIGNTTVNLSNLNSTNFTNVALDEGKYRWNCRWQSNLTKTPTTSGLTNNWSTTNNTFVIDGSKPSNVTLSWPTANYQFTGAQNITSHRMAFNFTVYDSYSTNMKCNLTINNYIRNDSSVLIVNGTLSKILLNTEYLNTTVYAGKNGTNIWNISCRDSVTWRNYSASSTFYVKDSTAPGTPVANVSSATALKGATVTLGCSATDVLDPSIQYKYQIKGPLTGDDWSDTSVTTANEYAFTGTSNVGTYTYRCIAEDDSGNQATSAEYTIAVSRSEQQTSSSAGATTGTEAVEQIRTGRTAEIGPLTVEGSTKRMAKTAKLSFLIDGLAHLAEVTEIDSTTETVTVLVSSDPIEITLTKGESKTLDLNDDGWEETQISFNGLVSGKAEINFKLLVESVEEEPAEVVEPEPVEEKASKMGLWIALVVILIIAVVAYFVVTKKKK